jgi:LmbE family N-acetylglucosaminyl deacetylase
MEGFAERLRQAGIEPPFSGDEPEDGAPKTVEEPFGVPDELLTTRVDVSQYVSTKHAALVAHQTQMGPDQFFMRIPPEVFADIFGTETFQRVAGPGGSSETDLFADLP